MKQFQLAILAGIAISIGCIVNLQVGGLAGAVLFTFGLLTCVHFKLSLYTGTAGFIDFTNAKDWLCLFIILIGNVFGCLLMAVLMEEALPNLIEQASTIVEKRSLLTFWQSIILSMMCGFIMTTAVQFGRQGKFLPLLFGVPLFIMSGFLHSIADTFYILFSGFENFKEHWQYFLTIVFGNFVGCNLYRIIMLKQGYEW